MHTEGGRGDDGIPRVFLQERFCRKLLGILWRRISGALGVQLQEPSRCPVDRIAWSVRVVALPKKDFAVSVEHFVPVFVRRNFSIEERFSAGSCPIHGLLFALRGDKQDVGAMVNAQRGVFLVAPLALSTAAMFAEFGRLWRHVVGVPHDAARRCRDLPRQVFRPVEERHFPSRRDPSRLRASGWVGRVERAMIHWPLSPTCS